MSQVDAGEETLPIFDSKMYPNGVNADFYNCANLPNEELVATFAGRFENPEDREIAKAIPELLELLKKNGLGKNNKVCDIGGGTGVLLKHLSNNSKELICTEISAAFHDHLLKRVKEENLNNVTCVLNTDPHSPQLEGHDNSMDLILLCDVYHHLEYPRTMMRHLKMASKATGKLVIVDFIRNDDVHASHPAGWIMSHVRANQSTFISEICSAGWVLEKELIHPAARSKLNIDFSEEKLFSGVDYLENLQENYVLIFRPMNANENATPGAGWADTKTSKALY